MDLYCLRSLRYSTPALGLPGDHSSEPTPLLPLCMTSEPQRGQSEATHLGDGLAHSIAGFVTDPHFLPWGEVRTQRLELTQDGLVRKHLDFIFCLQAQVKQQVLFHTRRINAIPVNEEPAGDRGGSPKGAREEVNTHKAHIFWHSESNRFSSFPAACPSPAPALPSQLHLLPL